MPLPLHPECRLLKEHPCGLTAIEKAPGILSHPNRERASSRALFSLPYNTETEAYEHPDGPLFLLNRLDAPTSGLLLLATNRETAEEAREAFRRHRVEKVYLAVVKGAPRRDRERWADFLRVRRFQGRLRTEVAAGRPNATTAMNLVSRSRKPPLRALIKLLPETGRTHQLRVQCAHRRLPILGDATYGDFRFNRDHASGAGRERLYLHSQWVGISLEVAGKAVRFEAESPLPEAFTVALG